MVRALGSLPDPPDPRDRQALPFLRAAYAGALPYEASLRQFVLSVLDQGRLGSCVANAAMQAIRMHHVISGVVNPELGSRLAAYIASRAIHGNLNDDSGTYTRTMFQGLNKFGFCRERFWTYDDNPDDAPDGTPAKFRRQPDAAAIRAAFDQKSPTVYSRISADGYDRIDAIKRAIAAKHPVVFGTDVSRNFCNDVGTAGVIGPPNGLAIAGGHELIVCGYRGDEFEIVNSWSDKWGQDGFCLFSADYLAAEISRDFVIVEKAPYYSEAA